MIDWLMMPVLDWLLMLEWLLMMDEEQTHHFLQ